MKKKQTELFGAMQVFAVQRKWGHVADLLEQLARLKIEFHDTLMSALKTRPAAQLSEVFTMTPGLTRHVRTSDRDG